MFSYCRRRCRRHRCVAPTLCYIRVWVLYARVCVCVCMYTVRCLPLFLSTSVGLSSPFQSSHLLSCGACICIINVHVSQLCTHMNVFTRRPVLRGANVYMIIDNQMNDRNGKSNRQNEKKRARERERIRSHEIQNIVIVYLCVRAFERAHDAVAVY